MFRRQPVKNRAVLSLRHNQFLSNGTTEKLVSGMGLTILVGGTFGLAFFPEKYFLMSVCSLCIGLIVLLIPLFPRPENRTIEEFVFVFLFCIIGTYFRIYALDVYPPKEGVLLTDEAISGLRGFQILNGDYWSLHIPIFTMAYPTALSFKIFGYSMYSLRIQFIVFGILTLPCFYILARLLSGRSSALYALAILSFCRWHNVVGRIAIDWVHVPLLAICSFYFFWLGTFKNYRYYIVCGLVWFFL